MARRTSYCMESCLTQEALGAEFTCSLSRKFQVRDFAHGVRMNAMCSVTRYIYRAKISILITSLVTITIIIKASDMFL